LTKNTEPRGEKQADRIFEKRSKPLPGEAVDRDTPAFNAIWEVIKTWDINVPEAYGGYCGATGSHVQAILNVLHERNLIRS